MPYIKFRCGIKNNWSFIKRLKKINNLVLSIVDGWLNHFLIIYQILYTIYINYENIL